MNSPTLRALAVAAALVIAGPVLAATPAAAPAPPLPEYGVNLTAEQAQTVMTKAVAEAKQRGVAVAIAIVEPNGALTMFQRMTGASYNAIDSAQLKARSAALQRRPTSYNVSRAPLISPPPNTVASNGGELIMVGGRIVGAIGVAGSGAELDIAKAAVAALN